ncbi:MAG: alpha/beta fold hydrolase, partial [Bdellovibrionota bacterium]
MDTDILFIIGGLIFSVVIAVGIVLFVVHHARQNPNAIPEAHPPATIEELIPDSKYVDVEGVKLHYLQAGEGPDVVLLHGIGASVYIWRFLFPILQKRHRVTAIDIAGFGKSAKDPRRDYGLDAQAELLTRALKMIGVES